ncbi:uncharacterized protein EKO05_0009991 [Ascochyta rabiei]|nr:uncharacterized protein EKO05_0009991 [Ascochyta rabiei]UPX19738.1 hypothetical protein EKO05_0009991 [Ascochyta rabiei]
MISLVASLVLFGMMAAVRRPFEAHLFAYGQRQPTNPDPTSPPSRRLSEDRAATEKLVPKGGMPGDDYTRSTSLFTNADVETLDLNSSRPASIVQSSSPSRDQAGLGAFTSPFAPPSLPPAFTSPSLQLQAPVSVPFAHRRCLSLTPRTDALLAPAAYAPYSIPIEFSASAQRAVYPDTASPYRSISTCRSQPHLRSMSSFSNRHRYSRSSVSLSRPHRLSSLTPVPHLGCSSGSDTLKSSEGISETGESPNGESVASSTGTRATAAEIVHAIASNTPIPGTDGPSQRKHWRTVSAPDATAGAQQVASGTRMAMGWKPDLGKSKTAVHKPPPLSFNKLMRSASAELLGRFGPMADRAAGDAEMKWKREFEVEVETRLNAMHLLPFSDGRKSLSAGGSETETLRESYDAGSLEDEARFEDAKEVLSVRPVSRDIAFV